MPHDTKIGMNSHIIICAAHTVDSELIKELGIAVSMSIDIAYFKH